jgi:hypothetical protein
MKWLRRWKKDRPAQEPVDVPPDSPTALQAAQAFWAGWDELLPNLSVALGEKNTTKVETELSALVTRLHPKLTYALERGQTSIYALVISGQEDPRLRPYTDSWMELAPSDNPLWEFHDSVPPVPDPHEVTINIGGFRIELADIRVFVQKDATAGVVDVAVYHPGFADLDEAARSALTFLPLDATLGERRAAARLRRVETAIVQPSEAMTLLEFRQLVIGMDEA